MILSKKQVKNFWNEIVSYFVIERYFNKEQTKKLYNNVVAKLIAFAPFTIENIDYEIAKMFSFANISTYLTAVAYKDTFKLEKEYDYFSIYDRSTVIFSNIEKVLVKTKKDLENISFLKKSLYLISLNDFKKDKKEDLKKEVYNVFNDDIKNVDIEKSRLQLEKDLLDSNNPLEMIVSTKKIKTRSWWDG